jgi:hypothetical protein
MQPPIGSDATERARTKERSERERAVIERFMGGKLVEPGIVGNRRVDFGLRA